MKRTVLVIDDDKMILDMIQGILEDKFEVSAVNDGQKAFRVLERIHPDVILLDLKMPGMDGYDVISRLKVNQEYKSIPVIFLTAVTDEYLPVEGKVLLQELQRKQHPPRFLSYLPVLRSHLHLQGLHKLLCLIQTCL